MRPPRPFRALLLLALVAAPIAACSDDSQSSTSADSDGPTTVAPTAMPTTTVAATTTAAPEPLRILVTNDDGIGAPGIDALVNALLELPDVEVTVVAPAENQSGSADKTTPVTPDAVAGTTASGYAGWAVPGFPADSVVRALETVLDEPPHVVLSGSNAGQNIGPFASLSGTVGAAKTAARRGIPALAVSSGLAEPTDFTPAVAAAIAWVDEHRDELLARNSDAALTTIESINAPTCASGEVRGVMQVPLAVDFADRPVFDPVACDAPPPAEAPTDDVGAFLAGYVSHTVIPV